ncbi:alpha/beta fold hydrolase [Bordetella sp. FB-8]|uniref:alpha/beta fold hydrolase n=1 Tax=Bordetella sp. FB-8 TaxID=1159870 RepID=UPI00035FB014|nr:alpha/beta hydrolase [Bordetella sp. FB-8]
MPSQPRLDYVTCASPAGLHRMAYWEWGDPGNDRVLLCVHGLTRAGRDFDELAQHLSSDFRVVCPDVVGRGASDWLLNPSFYTVPQYVADMTTLLARLRPAILDWVGTSMGGLIGLGLAGTVAMTAAMRAADPRPGAWSQDLPRHGLRFNRMVLNDIGPRLEVSALMRIGAYVGQPVAFSTLAEAVQATRQTAATFGPHTDEQWETFTRRVFRQREGWWVKHYDQGLAAPLAGQNAEAYATGENLLWQAYDALDCPVLIVRGAESDLLSAATLAQMRARNTRSTSIEFAGVGHAPTLMTPEQIEPIAAFLRGSS